MAISPDPIESITCQDSVRMVSLLRDNELNTQDAAKLERHILRCPRCQTARQQFEHLHTGLDTLLARSPTHAIQTPSCAPAAGNLRRQFLARLTSAGAAMFVGGGTGYWLASAPWQTAQSTEDAIAHRIAQYQALYLRETVQDADLPYTQQQAALMQWLEQAPQASKIKSAPSLTAQGLVLVRAQRLGLEKHAVLQWVYLPKQGQPVALCGIANLDKPSTLTAPQVFADAGMRGMHWRQGSVLWVLVTPQKSWSAQQLIELQERISPQLS